MYACIWIYTRTQSRLTFSFSFAISLKVTLLRGLCGVSNVGVPRILLLVPTGGVWGTRGGVCGSGGELMLLVSPCPTNRFSQPPVALQWLRGWKGLVDNTQSVSLSLPSSILFNTLTLLVTDITFQRAKCTGAHAAGARSREHFQPPLVCVCVYYMYMYVQCTGSVPDFPHVHV